MPTEAEDQPPSRRDQPTGKKDQFLDDRLGPAPFGRMANDPSAGGQVKECFFPWQGGRYVSKAKSNKSGKKCVTD